MKFFFDIKGSVNKTWFFPCFNLFINSLGDVKTKMLHFQHKNGYKGYQGPIMHWHYIKIFMSLGVLFVWKILCLHQKYTQSPFAALLQNPFLVSCCSTNNTTAPKVNIMHIFIKSSTQIVFSVTCSFFDKVLLQIRPLVTFTAILKKKMQHFCCYFLEAILNKLKHGTKTKFCQKKLLSFIACWSYHH